MKKIQKPNHSKRLVIIAIVIILAFASSLTLYTNITDNIKKYKVDAINQAKDDKFELIWHHLQNLLIIADANATAVSTSIESDIKNTFDLNILKTAMDENDIEYLSKLQEIFVNNIDGKYLNDINNNRNAFLIISGDGKIIEDYTIDLYHTSINKDFYKNNSFYRYKDIAINKPLFETAYSQLRSHTDEIIAIEYHDYIGNNNHILISEINFNTLKSVYLKEGINGLKNYEFLVPVYITDTGDIFNQKDIQCGVPQENHKFIVIQAFNLYDQVLKAHVEYDDVDYVEPIEDRYNNIINSLHILGILICIAVVISIFYIISMYNRMIDNSCNNDLN